MYRFFFLLTTALCLSYAAKSQVVSMDSTFSVDAFTQTGEIPPTMYSRPLGILPNGNIVLGGFGINPYGLQVNTYSPDGDSIATIRLPFLPDVGNGAAALKILEDGKMLFDNGSSLLLRYFPDGTVDSSFGIHGATALHRVNIREIVTSTDGKIYAAGESAIGSGAVVVAYEANGHPDSTFAEDGVFEYTDGDLDFFYALKLQDDGKIVVCGFSYYDNVGRPTTLYRLTTTGTLDTTFGTGGVVKDYFSGSGEAYGMAIQPDQKIVITGYTNPPYYAVVARYLQDGRRDSSFGVYGISKIPQVSEGTDVIIQPDGKILVYAWHNLNNTTHQTALVQLLPNGGLDPSFGNNGLYFSPNLGMTPPMTFATMGDHKILACGRRAFYTSTSVSHYLALQRFVTDLNIGTINLQHDPVDAGVFIYPNPINDVFTLKFNLNSAEFLDIEVLDMQGKQVQTIQRDQLFAAGQHEAPIQLHGVLPSGEYVLSLRIAGKPVIGVQFLKN